MGKKILVTGGNGFLAAHVIKQLLEYKREEYTVVASVRTAAKAADVIATASAHPRLSTVLVPDISAPDAFFEAIKEGNFDGVFHTAAPFKFGPETTPRDVLDPGIASTTAILHAAKKYGPKITRVVLTSSFVAVIDQSLGYAPGKVYKDDDWNPISLEKILEPGDLIRTYFGAKAVAERAAWDFIKDEKPSFDLVALLPVFIFGKVIHKLDSLAGLNTSNAILYNYISGGLKDKPIPDVAIPYWIDVEDLAASHITAYEKKEASNKRILVTNPKPFSNLEITQILKSKYPNRAENIPSELDTTKYDANGFPIGGHYTHDLTRSDELLGIKYKPFDVMLGELIESLKPLEVKEGKI